MLFQLGGLQIDTVPFEAHETSRESGADFASKDVVGAPRPREFVGGADERFTLSGTLFPYNFGGLTGLGALDGIRASGDPQILVRGDGANLGWFLVEKVREKSSKLGPSGVGRVIEYELTLVRSPNAGGGGGAFSLFSRLFA